MVDMWMLSVAAELIGPVAAWDSPVLPKLEEAVRAVPGLGEALDAARAATESDRIRLAEELADALKAAHDDDGAFATRLDELWRKALFGPKPRKAAFNIISGIQGPGTVIQTGNFVGSISFPDSPAPARSRFPFFGSDRSAKKDRP